MKMKEMHYCKDCKTFECEIPEVQRFITWMQGAEQTEYEYCGCPDKEGSTLTSDLQFKNMRTGEIVTIEVKRLYHGFTDGSEYEEKNIALMNGMLTINGVVSEVLEYIDDDIKKYL